MKHKALLTSLLVIAVIFGIFLTVKVTGYANAQANDFFLTQAKLVAAATDPNDIRNFSGDSSELTTPGYKLTLERLTRIKQSMKDARFVYLMRLDNDQVHFIFDTEDIHSKDYSPPGEVFNNPSKELRNIFITGQPFVEGPFHDQWGDWVSAHAPIYDPHSGKIIAISGIDINAATWSKHVKIYKYSSALISALLVSFMFGCIFLHNAVKHWQEAEEQVNRMARFDALTGLPNRYLINEILERVILDAEKNEKKFALLFMDINNFKWVNDTLGHSTGDKLLQIIASRLKQVLRRADTFGRLGGDEFIFILENLVDTHENALSIAEKIQNTLSMPITINGLENFSILASIGIAIYPKHGETAEKLMSNADYAMYQAKKNPFCQIVFFTHEYTYTP
ncbi:diguanylate cyclase domain-containing protein [Aquirhabdus sp.]|uniref:diguanylate cyclase domain-containing protein n=1 Tax=Aquirhabdus sp. TaxID=2824160 RepID=UPI00396CE984